MLVFLQIIFFFFKPEKLNYRIVKMLRIFKNRQIKFTNYSRVHIVKYDFMEVLIKCLIHINVTEVPPILRFHFLIFRVPCCYGYYYYYLRIYIFISIRVNVILMFYAYINCVADIKLFFLHY